jgi:ABC-type transport system substrate-binding protein
MKAVGITMKLSNQEWATFLTTRKSGDYSVARNGWLCDYNDPSPYWICGLPIRATTTLSSARSNSVHSDLF